MKEKVQQIKQKLDKEEKILRLKKLQQKINSNKDYLSLMKQFNDNKDYYIEKNMYNEQLLKVRKQLFEMPELTEYLKLQSELRLEFTKINNIILGIID